MRARFGDCVLDTDARELTRGGRRVGLSAKGIELLALLIRERPRALAQSALRDVLWPDTHVGYTSLARVVSEVRKATGDSADGESVIRTVPRFGYAFAGTAVLERAPEPTASRYLLVGDDRDFVLPCGDVLVGRGSECAVRLPSTGVSRVHARLQVGERGAVLEDQGSKNGTRVNGRKIEGPVALEEGDEVLVGTYRVVFRSFDTVEKTRTASPGR